MDERLKALVEKGYDYNLVIQLSTFNLEDVLKSVNLLMDEASDIAQPSNFPHIYFVGGQPGSGKSSAMKRISKMESNSGVVNVEMDAYRIMNPKVENIKQAIFDFYKDKNLDNKSELMSRDWVTFTKKFADAVADNYIVELFNKGYNMIIESTFNSPIEKLKLAQNMRMANPNCVVSVIAMGISYDVALNGDMARTQQINICLNKLVSDAKAKKIEIAPISRGIVSRKYYDSICANLPKSMEIFSNPRYSQILNGNVQIQDRKGNIYYDRNKDGLSKSASQVELDSLYGSIAQKQIEENKQESKHFYGVQTLIKENKYVIESIYGSVTNAKKVFEEEVKKIRDLLANQVMTYSQVVSYQPVILESNRKKR